ncbi:DUF4424 domain-containing protein [Sphingosinicella sp. BN140058]|uniref:DUF4424 domain-containing protein n=1 Tax=Sphingosinicella sp. BN140058 TaxID=1892855 RepID=UPI0010129AE8|nr:DUF4424 domain-containing protein [Sphingosinicella sp. BN140058]QAY76961.1 DUF4424 domain-containing protein [Sphingosinicella sp. BN140058]
MTRIVQYMAAVAAVCLAATALANDSTAETAAGGLVLTRTDAIDMVSEDLFVSAEKVRVRYVFRNRTGKDVRTTVAFPMPDDELANREYGDIAFPHDFTTKVDGKPVGMSVERKAMLGGEDHTALLAALSVPLSDDPGARLDRLAKAEQDRLLALGLVQADESDAGAGAERHLAPLWTVRETHYWEQVFPAGRDLLVEHEYVPGTGGSVGTPLVLPGFRDSPEGKALIAEYCIDPAFLGGVDRLARQMSGETASLPDRTVSYVLKTGANWRSPIGSFRLVVDKGAPENLVSFCADGVRKIGPTQFEVRHQNWRPAADLHVLIISPRGR